MTQFKLSILRFFNKYVLFATLKEKIASEKVCKDKRVYNSVELERYL